MSRIRNPVTHLANQSLRALSSKVPQANHRGQHRVLNLAPHSVDDGKQLVVTAVTHTLFLHISEAITLKHQLVIS